MTWPCHVNHMFCNQYKCFCTSSKDFCLHTVTVINGTLVVSTTRYEIILKVPKYSL